MAAGGVGAQLHRPHLRTRDDDAAASLPSRERACHAAAPVLFALRLAPFFCPCPAVCSFFFIAFLTLRVAHLRPASCRHTTLSLLVQHHRSTIGGLPPRYGGFLSRSSARIAPSRETSLPGLRSGKIRTDLLNSHERRLAVGYVRTDESSPLHGAEGTGAISYLLCTSEWKDSDSTASGGLL